MSEIPLEVFTLKEVAAQIWKFLDAVDERGRVYVVRHPHGQKRSMLYKIIAMGPTTVPIKKHGVRPVLENREPTKIWEKL